MSEWLAELPEWARDLLAGSRVGRLGLRDDDGDPRVLPITFALFEGFVWSAIDHKRKRGTRPPARIGFLERRPRVALTVDRYAEDWQQLAWLQLLGSATVIEAERRPLAITALRARYEQYRREEPPGPLIRIEVERTLCWRAAP